jgi:integrase
MKESKRQKPSDEKSVWRRVEPGLVRYVSSGIFFARFRAGGKLVWRSLKTDSIAVARLRLRDMQRKEQRKTASGRRITQGKLTMGDAIALFRQRGFRPVRPRTPKDKRPLKPAALAYYEQRVKAIISSWPGFTKAEARDIKQRDVERWFDKVRSESAPSVFNNTLGIVRKLFDEAVHVGARFDNPAQDIIRESETPKPLTLPTPDQFQRFIHEIETSGSGKSRSCADLVRFLAYTGCRKGEAAAVTWSDVNFVGGTITLRGPDTGLKNRRPGEVRVIPLIPEARQLLERLRDESPDAGPGDPVMKVRECQKAMSRAAQVVGMPRITHHDLRHLFATGCIESGVDIPTVSRWLGHKDGGALAMRIYGHLRDHHSTEMAAKVSFAPKVPGDVVPMPREETAS